MIVLSQLVWDIVLDEFRWPRRAVERVAYIDGMAFDELKIATTVTLPDAEMHTRHFTVSGEAMSEAGQHFRRFGLERLAQVHTHPGQDVRHSSYDDENAYSQLDGSVSIVLPQHAVRRPQVSDCGVHVRQDRGWRRLRPEEIAETIRLIPGCLDFRRYK